MKNVKQRIKDAIELEKFVVQRAKEVLFIRFDEEDAYVDSCSFYNDNARVGFTENRNTDKFIIELTLGELILSEKDWKTYKKVLKEELEGIRKREKEFEDEKFRWVQLELVKKTAKELGFDLVPKLNKEFKETEV